MYYFVIIVYDCQRSMTAGVI